MSEASHSQAFSTIFNSKSYRCRSFATAAIPKRSTHPFIGCFEFLFSKPLNIETTTFVFQPTCSFLRRDVCRPHMRADSRPARPLTKHSPTPHNHKPRNRKPCNDTLFGNFHWRSRNQHDDGSRHRLTETQINRDAENSSRSRRSVAHCPHRTTTASTDNVAHTNRGTIRFLKV